MMNKQVLMIYLLSLGMTCSAFASAGAEPCLRQFDVGLANYAPVAYWEEGSLKGIAHDLTRELARRTSCVFSEKDYPRPAAISQMRAGKIDLFLISGSLLEFGEIGGFVPMYETERSLTFYPKENGKHNTIQDVIDDKNIKFGIMIGSQTSLTAEEYKKLVSSNRTVGAPGPEELFRMLKSRRIQAIMFTSGTAKYYIKKHNLEGLVRRIPDPAVKTTVGYIYSKRRMSERDKELIAKTMESIKKDGTLSKIFASYYDSLDVELRLK